MGAHEAGTTASGPSSGRPLGAISTLVSLFLLLLVFFIVLFSIAQIRQQRLDAVITSIDDAFGRLPSSLGVLTRPVDRPVEAGPEGFARAAASLVGELGGLGAGDHPAPPGVLLEIDLAPAQLFQAGRPLLQPGATAILDRLALLLQRREPDRRYRLTIRAGAAPGAAAAASAQLTALAASLFARGCPADALAIGLLPDPAIAFRLDFALIGDGAEAE
jgi:Membrane MotB of proton-channel complex MotA/MotB